MKFISLDSLNGGVYNTDCTNNSFVFINGSKLYSPNDYNIVFQLPTPIYHVQRVYLKSFATTILFNTVRAASQSNFLNINCGGGVVKQLVLADAIYTSITTLIADLNTAATATFPTDGFTFSIDTLTGCVKLKSTANPTINLDSTNLGYILGFRKSINPTLPNTVIAGYMFNLSIDQYLNIYISNLNSGISLNANKVLSHFTVPVNYGSYTINYSSTNLSFEQYVDVSSYYQPITQLNVCIRDRWGFSVHSNGANFTMVLAVE